MYPAWIVDGEIKKVIYVSKYMNVIEDGRAYSLPMKSPATYHTFDDCVAACLKKGRGWHLFTHAEWMAVAQWDKKTSTRPHGNTAEGCDHWVCHEKGIAATMRAGETQLTKTGSGPVTWTHNGNSAGIADLVGNMFEWVGGLRLLDGVIQIIPDNDAARYDCETLARHHTKWNVGGTWRAGYVVN